MLGLDYPGGPAIARAAEQGDPTAYSFPRALIRDRTRLEFSFSGLKTAVRYAIVPPGRGGREGVRLTPRQVADLAASFQQAVVDVLVAKAMVALESCQLSKLCVGGGVAANRLLRQSLAAECQARGFELFLRPPRFVRTTPSWGRSPWKNCAPV